MSVETHSFMDGKVHLYKRERSRFWQCSTYLNGRNYRQTTKEQNIAHAKAFAKDWFMELYVEDSRRRRGGKSLITDGVIETPIGVFEGRADRRRGRAARREMGRNPVRLRRAQARRDGDGGRDPRLLPHTARAVQMPPAHRVPGDPEDLHGQDPEVRTARIGTVAPRLRRVRSTNETLQSPFVRV